MSRIDYDAPMFPYRRSVKSGPVEPSEDQQLRVDWENELEARFEVWGHAFIAWARECGAFVEDVGLDYVLDLAALQRSLASMADTPGKGARHQSLLAKFHELSVQSNGYLASRDAEGIYLRLSKPGSAWRERDMGALGRL